MRKFGHTKNPVKYLTTKKAGIHGNRIVKRKRIQSNRQPSYLRLEILEAEIQRGVWIAEAHPERAAFPIGKHRGRVPKGLFA